VVQPAKTDWAQLYCCEKSSKARWDRLMFTGNLVGLNSPSPSLYSALCGECAEFSLATLPAP
jgi:hypothetical protein